MKFATPFERPLYYPGFRLGIGIRTHATLYWERKYLDKQGTVLAIRSTLVSERGLIGLQELGSLPEGTVEIHTCLTTENNATEADPVIVAVASDSTPLFATPFIQPVLFGNHPLSLAIGISNTRQVLYYEREYFDKDFNTLEIRSQLVYDRGTLACFPVSLEAPPNGTRWINACITSENRGLASANNEYTIQEHNAQEYN